MAWKATFSGALLLAAACGDAESQLNEPVQGAEQPSPALSPAVVPPSGSSVASPEGTSPVNEGASTNVSPMGPSPTPPGGDVEPDDAPVAPAPPAIPPTATMGDHPAPPPVASTSEVEPEPVPDSMDEGVDGGTAPTPTADAASPLSFAADIWPLWSLSRDPVFVYRGMGSYTGCADETAPCHGAANPGALLSMVDADTAYAQMMNTPSTSGICEGTQRVVVGDPAKSCLVLFYEGRLGPRDLDWVDEAEIELMREWIRQGAEP